MRWAEITLSVPPSAVESVSAVLTMAGCAGVVVIDPNAVSSDPFADWVVPDEGARSRRSPDCRVTGYLPVDDRLEPALEDLRCRLDILVEEDILSRPDLLLKTVEDDAWAEAWKAYFKPIRVGRRFVVKPSWESWNAAEDDLIIEIDPGMAFGSGSHPSTRLCLMMLEDVVRPGANVLDWGTGSGILAVGAARLQAATIHAIDLDPVAVRVAEENAARNGFADRMQAVVASIEALPSAESFDLIIGNIVADPIIQGAREIAARLRPESLALVSGIIELRAAEVIAALEAAGMRLQRTKAEEDWRALLFVLTALP